MSETGQPAPGAGTIPYCYRHPERESHIRCQRCNRPICPDCMRAASVGFQCPDCVKEGNAGLREARTSFGGRIRQGPPYITYGLIAINAAFFVIAQATGPDRGGFVRRMELLTSVDLPQFGYQGVAQGSYWQLITSTFLHTGVIHFALNMFCLYIFGPFLEQQLGRWRFTALYLISGFAGSVAIYLLTEPNSPPSLGASGAVFGLFGAALIVNLKAKRDVNQLLFLLGINLVFSFTAPDIAWQAHLGGLAAGTLLGAAMAYAPREHRQFVSVGVVVGTTVLCVALVILRTLALT